MRHYYKDHCNDASLAVKNQVSVHVWVMTVAHRRLKVKVIGHGRVLGLG